MKNKIAEQILFTGWGLIALMLAMLSIFWNKLPPELPWFYSLPDGEQQLTSKLVVAVIIAGMAIILGLTRLIARWIGKEDKVAETTIMAGGLAATILMAASFGRIMAIFIL